MRSELTAFAGELWFQLCILLGALHMNRATGDEERAVAPGLKRELDGSMLDRLAVVYTRARPQPALTW